MEPRLTVRLERTKTGRPKKDKPRQRDRTVYIRLTEQERDQLIRCAVWCEQTITEYIVSCSSPGIFPLVPVSDYRLGTRVLLLTEQEKIELVRQLIEEYRP